jgi:RNA polymerase sigma-70 factor (ECF subfamily)
MNDVELTFDEIYRTYRVRILHYMSRLVGEAESEDLTQETFVKVNKKLDGFRGESTSQLITWLYRIATNTALDRLRSPSFRELVKNRLSGESIENVVSIEELKPFKAHTVEQQVIREEMSACVRSVIDQLPKSYKTVIVLSNLEGFKDSEIGPILGLSNSAVKIRLHRARTQLKAKLANQCVFYRNDENELSCDRKSTDSM